MNFRPVFIGAGLTVLLALSLGGGLYYALFRITRDLPRLPADPRELGIRPGSEIYAASGQRIYTFNQNRQWVRWNRLAPMPSMP